HLYSTPGARRLAPDANSTWRTTGWYWGISDRSSKAAQVRSSGASMTSSTCHCQFWDPAISAKPSVGRTPEFSDRAAGRWLAPRAAADSARRFTATTGSAGRVGTEPWVRVLRRGRHARRPPGGPLGHGGATVPLVPRAGTGGYDCPVLRVP